MNEAQTSRERVSMYTTLTLEKYTGDQVRSKDLYSGF